METLTTQVTQRGFFTLGIALALSAIFGATAATVVTLDKKDKQEIAAMQQLENPQWQATSMQVAAPDTATVRE